MGKLTLKISLLVICEILAVFVNTLTTNGKYPLRNCENLPLPIQMQLSKKQKLFHGFLFYLSTFHPILNILIKR